MKKKVILIFLFLFNVKSYSQTISTYAGNGLNGFGNNGIPTYSGDGGGALQAQINPQYLGVDSKNNIYISQGAAYYTVRKIDVKTGIITTVAGNATSGYSGDGGHATLAQLNEPRGIAFDSHDNLYIADYWNNCIRRVDAVSNIITTIAGNGAVLNGYTGNGGPAKDALLFEPWGIAFDKSDNLYFTDFNNNCIRKIDALTGVITKVAGSDPPGYGGFSGDGGLAINAKLFAPSAIVISKAGDIYFTDMVNSRIRKIDAQTGIITTVAGNGEDGFLGDNGPAVNAQMYMPMGLSIDDSGNLYVCGGDNNQSSYNVRKVNIATGIITAYAGDGNPAFSGDGGPPLKAGMSPTTSIFDALGNMFIADEGNYRVREIINNNTATAPTSPVINYSNACTTGSTLFNLKTTDNIDAVNWDFGDPASGINNTSQSFNPQHNFKTTGAYLITVTVYNGSLSATNTQIIQITDCGNSGTGNNPDPGIDLTIPNTFSPNGDGINDKFGATSPGSPVSYTMNIYNRYGVLLFLSNNIGIAWDGKYNRKYCPAGVYYFVLKYQFSGLPVKVKSGSITLLR
ncbi:adhesin/invasin [Mucilaginibacter mallensis]|uniref:Adhesin/invasin n=1 Tax=Mucilaginibacter mallensis TaxID=652787 RepID=A0A1H2C6P0_MUCMA|nr:gliding motility-associated C-terminal domain-containing protein [Mucilaginibacter mallensis]SDT66044.1 adhesin/invasin [Mucilaginibacter mallensis]